MFYRSVHDSKEISVSRGSNNVAQTGTAHCMVKKIHLVAAASILWCSVPASAQTEKGPVRTVLALGRVLSSASDTPMSFKLLRVSIPAGASTIYRGADSLIYVMSGVVAVTIANDRRSVRSEEGAYIPPGIEVTVQAGADSGAELLQYQLLRSADMSKSAMNAPASVTELHQMNIPADSVKSGPHEFSLTRVTLPAGASRPRPHTRSGAALYYVLADGTITIWPSATVDALSGESRTESHRVGDIQEEPYGFIHSWSPKADAPLTLLQANISQEGVPEIIFVK
jgi:quercetin dioxygenase-like cupin family protein